MDVATWPAKLTRQRETPPVVKRYEGRRDGELDDVVGEGKPQSRAFFPGLPVKNPKPVEHPPHWAHSLSLALTISTAQS